MPIRITGMNSGLDTDSIIQELVNAQRKKIDVFKKDQTKLGWKQEAWKTLNGNINKLFNETLNKMRYEGNYKKKTTNIAGSNAVSIITGEGAVNGVQTLGVTNVAKAGLLTGGVISGNVKGDTKLSELSGINFAADGTAVFNVKTAGKTTEIKLTGENTLDDVAKKLQAAGVNANFDVKNQRFYVSSKDFGEANDFSITASDATSNELLSAVGLKASLDSDKATLEEYKTFSNYYVPGDRAATLANMQGMIDSTVSKKTSSYKKQYNDTLEQISTTKKNLDKLLADPGYDSTDPRTEEDLNLLVEKLNKEIADLPDGDEKKAKQEELKTTQKQLDYLKTYNNYQKNLTELNDKKNNLDEYVTVSIGSDGKVATAVATAKLTEEVETSYYDRAEYAKQVIANYEAGLDTGSAKKITAQDAVISLNGVEYKSSNNVFEINGLTITANEKTNGEEITVTTKDDTEGIYDTVKNFIKEYNVLVIEMDKLYNAKVEKGYQPLTDEEKEAMSEKEIEKWEEKIKESVLRRDSTLGTFSSEMKAIMSTGIEINGKTMYLSDFGINTLGYFSAAENERNAYHIDGDEDDGVVSAKDDKLKGMIATDPDTVGKFFSSLTKSLYDKMNKLMAGSENSSIYTAYDDKKMKKDYDAYTEKIKKQEAKVTAMEDKWYKKFSAMETALAKMQSNQSAIAGLLGGSQ